MLLGFGFLPLVPVLDIVILKLTVNVSVKIGILFRSDQEGMVNNFFSVVPVNPLP